MGHPWARPLHVSSCPTLKRTAHPFHTFLSKASVSLWMATHSTAPWAFFTSTLAMAASRWMATWAETILWSNSGPCFIPTANWCGLVMLRTFLVRSLDVALQTSRLVTCPMAKGRTPPLGLVAGTIRAARYVPRISDGTSAVASLQKASHTQSHGSPSNSVIRVQCSYLPPPGPVALLEGENLMASRSWQRKLCFGWEGHETAGKDNSTNLRRDLQRTCAPWSVGARARNLWPVLRHSGQGATMSKIDGVLSCRMIAGCFFQVVQRKTQNLDPLLGCRNQRFSPHVPTVAPALRKLAGSGRYCSRLGSRHGPRCRRSCQQVSGWW